MTRGRRGYPATRKARFRDCEDWKRFRRGAWDNPWESVNLRDLVGHDLYDQIMRWNDAGALDALHIAEQRKQAARRRVPCWVPKLKDDIYVPQVDWEIQESVEASDLPQSAADAFQEEAAREDTQLSHERESHQEIVVGEWPVEPTGWDCADGEPPQSGWKNAGWQFLAVWDPEAPLRTGLDNSQSCQLRLIMERC